MAGPQRFIQQGKQKQTQKQSLHLMMTMKMQKALFLLQLPIQEIEQFTLQEMQTNPLLEFVEHEKGETEWKEEERFEPLSFDEDDYKAFERLGESFQELFNENSSCYERGNQGKDQREYLEANHTIEPSPLQSMLEQALVFGLTKKEKEIATFIIFNLDDRGFLSLCPEEMALFLNCSIEDVNQTLSILREFEPLGSFQPSLKESLLFQLRKKNKVGSSAYKIVSECFEDLLQNKIGNIEKKLGLSKNLIAKAIKNKIEGLLFSPLQSLEPKKTRWVLPDGKIFLDENLELKAVVIDPDMPPLCINRAYLSLLKKEKQNHELEDYVKEKLDSARWLMKTLLERGNTLQRILDYLIKTQKKFLTLQEGALFPLLMKEVAEELSLNESTIARAVAHKTIDTPRGLLSLRSFFTTSLKKTNGESISSHTIKEKLKRLIEGENQKTPLSDKLLSKLFKQEGIEVARRTIAKYRKELNIENTQKRRRY